MTKKLILGTAGHIDHGKSSLVKVLTGIDPDRLAEEKKRGITIELGFGELTIGEVAFGIVDVPGHERFVRTMVAGATGIDIVMLVIAADEGVMPQTREHLAICSLLGIQAGLVVLTKADLVDEEWLELVKEDVKETLAETFLADAPVLAVSSLTGEGLTSLKEELRKMGSKTKTKAEHALARLPIDRVFEVKGFGPVVTGTLASGRLAEGDKITLLPSEKKARIRGIQNHGVHSKQVTAGQRTAVNVQGLDLEDIHRGQVIVHTGMLSATKQFDARIKLLSHLPKPLKHRAPLLLHAGTVQVPCRVFLHERTPLAPGEEAYARILPEEPLVLLPNDRFILRGFQRLENHGTTFGGGVVLDPFPVYRKRDTELFSRLLLLETGDLQERLAVLIEDSGKKGIALTSLCQRVGQTQKGVEKPLAKLQSQGLCIRYEKEPAQLIHSKHFQAFAEELLERVAAFHQEHPSEEGMGRELLREKLGIESIRLFSAILDKLQKNKQLIVVKERVHLPEHRVRIPALEEALRRRIRELYVSSGCTPPRSRDLPTLLEEDERDVTAAFEFLVRKQKLIRVRDDLYFEVTVLESLQDKLIAFLQEHGELNAQDFKAITGASRKFSIPLAEYFDAKKITFRVGDTRKLLQRDSV